MKHSEYAITRTFSIKIGLWERLKEKMRREKMESVSLVIVRLIEKWLSGEVSL